MKVYISGQISGLPIEEAMAKFEKAEADLTNKGYEVVNPMKNGISFKAPWELHMAMDIVLLIGCQAIYLLLDWGNSKGATLEKNIAELTGKVIIYQETPAFAEIKQSISNALGISFFDIVGDSRTRRHVYARMIFAHYCRKEGATILRISLEMKRDHSTIVYYLRKFEDDNRYNPEFRHLVELVENDLSKN